MKKRYIIYKHKIGKVRTMKITRKDKGITLIALVITIIILLILAGIAISSTLGENGIFNLAKQAKAKTEEESAREKLELVLLDLQAKKHTDETYNKTTYIDTEISNNRMTVSGDIIVVDGWQFGIDRDVPEISVNLGKSDNPVKVEQVISYVGTTKCTVKVEATSQQADIIKYQYMVNNELKGETDKNEFTIENLEPATNYRISVIAIDEKENTNTSIPDKITTKERTYLIKDGILQIAGETKNATVAQGEGYLKLSIGPTGARGGYYITHNVTNYKEVKLDAEVISKTSECGIALEVYLSDPLTSTPVDSGESNFMLAGKGLTKAERNIVNYKISSLEGNYILACKKNASSNTSATVYIYNMWLEE